MNLLIRLAQEVRFSLMAGILGALLKPTGVVEAAVVHYQYHGTPLIALYPEESEALGFPVTLPGYSGLMIVDEGAVPGGSLADNSLSFSIDWHTDSDPGLLYFDIFPWPATSGSAISFTTNGSREIVDWRGDFLDGPPDGWISTTRDGYYIPWHLGEASGLYFSENPGTWTVTVVPIPAAAWLFLSGLVGFGLTKRREKQSA